MRILTLVFSLCILSSCGLKEKKEILKEESIRLEYLIKGGQIVELTQGELLKHVSQAMQQGGPSYAVDFCKMKAMRLKDSLSEINNCEIRRIALKYRNPADMPQTKSEVDQLHQYQLSSQLGDTLKPMVFLSDDRIEYYAPIILDKGACLVCHGTPGEHIAEETMEMIQANYPDDLATGFALNDFRGAWKITFMNEQSESESTGTAE